MSRNRHADVHEHLHLCQKFQDLETEHCGNEGLKGGGRACVQHHPYTATATITKGGGTSKHANQAYRHARPFDRQHALASQCCEPAVDSPSAGPDSHGNAAGLCFHALAAAGLAGRGLGDRAGAAARPRRAGGGRQIPVATARSDAALDVATSGGIFTKSTRSWGLCVWRGTTTDWAAEPKRLRTQSCATGGNRDTHLWSSPCCLMDASGTIR
mmetsp:Transcript_35833/g.64437  ORF Transcript_35833/g.64437 Transcript_35833/m.64437 type:complete len:213 (+) Transcript_35833:403-1041(+)